MRALISIAILLASGLAALAAYDENDPRPDLNVLRAQIEAGGASQAISPLRDWIVSNPGDADALNLLGYAYRKIERWRDSRKYYERALAIEPAHLGALEYMGEMELQTGNPGAARALLIRLQAACPDGCSELDDLIEAFAEHEIPTGGT